MRTKIPFQRFLGSAPSVKRGVSLIVPTVLLLLILSPGTGEPVAAADPALGIGLGLFQMQDDDSAGPSDEAAPPRGETSTTDTSGPVSADGREVIAPRLQPVGPSSRTVPIETPADDGNSHAEYLRLAIAAAAVLLLVVALSPHRSEPAGRQSVRRRTFSH